MPPWRFEGRGPTSPLEEQAALRGATLWGSAPGLGTLACARPPTPNIPTLDNEADKEASSDENAVFSECTGLGHEAGAESSLDSACLFENQMQT